MVTQLPESFIQQMKELLKDEFEAYIQSFEHERYYGLRVNTNKISVQDFLKISPFDLTPIQWTDNGFIMKEIKSLLNIRTTTPAFITFKSLLPCCRHRFNQ